MATDTAGDRQILADLRRELAQYKAERDEALAREAATAEVLQVINSSPGDLAPVFDAILEKALRLCDAGFGHFRTYDGERFPLVAVRGDERFVDVMHQRTGLVPGVHHPLARIIAGEDVNHIADAADSDAYRNDPRFRELVDTGVCRSLLGVALRKDKTLLGYVVVYRQEVRPFSDKQIALLQNFAAQAVIAIENARLITETREALEQQTATAEVLQVINSSPGDLAPVFEAMLEKAMHLCDAAFGGLATFHGDTYRVVATRNFPEPAALVWKGTLPIRPETSFGRIARGVSPIHIADVSADDTYRMGSPMRRALVDLGGARTALWVALRKDAAVLGTFVVYRQEVRPFSDKQIALLESFAAQAVIAMENARLITETREALEQQTATAEVLQVINSSPGDLAPVFDAMLDKAMRLCEASFGGLWTFDRDRYVATALRGVPDAYAQFLAGNTAMPGPGSAPSRFLHGERSVIQNIDLADEEPYRAGDPQRRALVDLGGARTALQVPLVKDDRVLGVITIYRQEVRPFTDKQIALLESFAAQAVIAMENARLITETREALEQQTATAEVLQVINSSPGDLAPVFDAILEKAHSLCGVAYGALYLCEGEDLRIVAAHGDPGYLENRREQDRFRPPDGTPLWRIQRGAPLTHLADARADDSYRTVPQYARVVDAGGIRTLLQLPLRKDDKLLGIITALRHEVRPFTDKQIALLQNFAAQAVIAIDNARLITETREALEQQTATAEVLQVINSSPGDLAPVFDAILEKAHTLCGADHGSLTLADGENFRAVAMRGIPEDFAAVLRQPFHPGRLIEELSGDAPFVQIANIAAGGRSTDNPVHRAAVGPGGVRTLLAVPLRKDGALLGYITANRREVRPFTDKQIALLQNFAAQAVIAMENARLLTETREALEQQTATAQVLQVINSSPGDLAPVFDAILEKAHSLCGVDHGSLQLYDGETYRAVAIRGQLASVAERLRQPRRPNPNLPAYGLIEGEPFVHVQDLAEIVGGARSAPVLAGVRTVLYVALRKEGALLGFIGAGRSAVRPFTDKQIALLQNFADQAVIAIENARLLGELRARTDEITGLNRELEARVATQLAELERARKLRRFLAPQLADLILAKGDESILETHRREIVVVFCDLRGFTGFAERAEPEEVVTLLRDYHAALGPIVARFEGTLDHYAGDGIMVFFNDPVPCPDPAKRAIEMAVAMREAALGLLKAWRRHGHDIGFGVGIAQGYATLGQIGFAERMDYTAIGTVTNLAARLCAAAKNGQILIGSRVAAAVEDTASLEEIRDLSLKGLTQAIAVYNVVQ